MESKYLVIGLIITVAVVGYFALDSSSATVSSQGQSFIESSPDKVSVWLNVEGRAENAQDSKSIHDEIIDSLLVKLFLAGVDRDSIGQVNYNIYPEYDWNNGNRELSGYVTSQTVVVELENFDLVTVIVDAGVDAGALVSSIQFELSDEKQRELKVQALEKAGEDARKKAEATARGLGKNLGGLISVRGEEFNYRPYRYFEAGSSNMEIAEEARNAALNIAPRDLEVAASVIVEYRLGLF